MLTRFLLLSFSIVLPQAVLAGPIVTWQASGATTTSNSRYPVGLPQAPAIGTPYSVTLAFNPGAGAPTPTAPAGSPCSTTAATGTLNIGGASYSLAGNAFTNSQLPGTNCSPGAYTAPGAIEFFMSTTPLGADVLNLEQPPRFLKLLYFDAVRQDGTFPSTPTVGGPFNHLYFQNMFFNFSGPFVPSAVTQPTPIPEPGTMALVGIGLAFAARRRLRTQPRR